jgi:hypothetical protein
MSNQPDSSDFQERDHFLRRTFTWQFKQPEDAAVLVRLCELLQEWIYETSQFGPNDDSEVKDEEFRAAGEELVLIGAYLRQKAEERFDCGYDEPIARRCERADRWAEQAEALGRLILEDVAQDEQDDEDGEDAE